LHFAFYISERGFDVKLLITSFIISFAAAAAAAPFAIAFLRRLKFGQSIREIGPSWHKGKSGTPTMGGIIFIFSILLSAFLLARDAGALLIVFCALGFGIVGFCDDYIKVVKKRNLGLRSKEKFALQTVVAVLFLAAVSQFLNDPTVIMIPFVKQPLDLGYWYYPFMLFVILGGVNSVNLTDGLDGLATGVTAIVLIFFGFAARFYGASSVTAVCAAAVGGLAAFLLFNKYPAKVFMGDVGSLFLGGLVVAAAAVLRQPLMLVIAGFVYFAETLSVILQVAWFKTTGKRIFKMSPIHHHFEMLGYSEVKIVALFCAITAIMCAVGYLGIR